VALIEDRTGCVGEVSAYLFNGDLAPEVLNDPRLLSGLLDSRLPDVVGKNMVTNVGRQQMTKLIMGESASLASYIGLSTSATTPSLAATALTNEIYRKAASIATSYLTYGQRRVTYFATGDFGSTGVQGEGIFDTASTGGSMWAIASISVSKTTTQSLVVSHVITMTT
jgi:hypothetical protein